MIAQMIRALVTAPILIGFAAFPQAQAPTHIGIDARPYYENRLERVVKAVARTENCAKLLNPGCLRSGDGSYRRYRRIEDGMADLRHEIYRRRGHTIRWILSDFNRQSPGYPDLVARVGKLDLDEVIP
jgi:hypothetical protein